MRPMPSLLTLLALTLLAGCAAVAPTAPPAAAPTAGPARQLQLLTDPASILAALPPDLAASDVAAPPAPADPAALAVWDDPAARWRELARQAAALDGADEAGVQAAVAALDAALNDGLALADLARAAGHGVSDDAVLAEVAWRSIAQAHPLRAGPARAVALTAAWAGCWRGRSTPPTVVTGMALGAATANAIAAQLQPRR